MPVRKKVQETTKRKKDFLNKRDGCRKVFLAAAFLGKYTATVCEWKKTCYNVC